MGDEVDELRARAANLRREAFDLLDGAGLLNLLRRFLGQVEIIGSVAMDLMVWRDIDLDSRLAHDRGDQLIALAAEVHRHLAEQGYSIIKLIVNDEYRQPNSLLGRGLYAGFRILTPGGEHVWKVDLWGWDEATFAEMRNRYQRLTEALANADRDVVLRIKDAVWDRPEYRDTLTSMDVYTFVIERAGSTIADFDAFLARRGAAAS